MGHESTREDDRTRWFRDARFGMFIHWGLYAIPSRCVWAISNEPITSEKYQEYVEEFDPIHYDPASWARAAKEAGMRYAVICTKQHDGFCLFDSQLTDYKATNTKARRDLIREYADAFRAEGLKIGFYYSLLDWHHPDYPCDTRHPMRNNEAYKRKERNFDRYLDYLHGQVRELCSNYGEISLLWFDFSYDDLKGEKWRATDLVRMVRSLQPGVVLNNRLVGDGTATLDRTLVYSGDFVTPEKIIPPAGLKDASGLPLLWESCLSINDNWGFVASDRNFKPAGMLIRKLVECVSKGGNMLLNVGPDARGNIPEPSLRILSQIGRWMKRNHAGIYQCGPAKYPKPQWGWFTQNGRKLYAHVLETSIGPHAIDVPPERVKRVRLLANGAELPVIRPWNAKAYGNYTFVDLGQRGRTACVLPDEVDTVLEIELKD